MHLASISLSTIPLSKKSFGSMYMYVDSAFQSLVIQTTTYELIFPNPVESTQTENILKFERQRLGSRAMILSTNAEKRNVASRTSTAVRHTRQKQSGTVCGCVEMSVRYLVKKTQRWANANRNLTVKWKNAVGKHGLRNMTETVE